MATAGRREPPSFTCPVCGMTSHNPTDAGEGYCGNCHDWTTDQGSSPEIMLGGYIIIQPERQMVALAGAKVALGGARGDAPWREGCLRSESLAELLGVCFAVSAEGWNSRIGLRYDGAANGQVALLAALAPYIAGGEIQWRTEDGAQRIARFLHDPVEHDVRMVVSELST